MSKFRIGHGYDVHRLAEGLPLVLGGIHIDSDKGCMAHSDGDVLIHSICDALLGAAALGDIGSHFPDDDPAYKNIASSELLASVCKKLESEGYAIGNIDSTIVLQEPKLMPYIDSMRENIARILGVAVESVSVKATTTECLGFAGRGEGVGSYSVVVIYTAEYK